MGASTLTNKAILLQTHALTCVELQRPMKLSSPTPRQVWLCPVVPTSRLLSSRKLPMNLFLQPSLSELPPSLSLVGLHFVFSSVVVRCLKPLMLHWPCRPRPVLFVFTVCRCTAFCSIDL